MVYFIALLVEILTWLVITHVILTYFLSPYHPLRAAIDRIVEPMLNPIRRVVPPLGMIDLSPLFLILILQLLGRLLAGLLAGLS